MKRVGMILWILLVMPWILGMGSARDEAPDKIPVPAKKFEATLVDQADVVTDCRDVSIEGRTLFEGKRGEGLHAVAFDDVREAVFRMPEGRLLVQLRMGDGTVIELAVNKQQKVYGLTRFGTFQIRLGDLKKMVFRK